MTQPLPPPDVAIIGGGPAGLMAAEVARAAPYGEEEGAGNGTLLRSEDGGVTVGSVSI